MKTYKKTGRSEKSKNRSHRERKCTDEVKSFIKSVLDDDCTTTYRTIRQKLDQEKNVQISERTIGRAVNSFNYSFKRTSPMTLRRNDPDVIEKRYQYALLFATLDDEKIYYLDEASFDIGMRRRYGRSKKGEKAVKIVPGLRTKKVSVSAAISKRCLFFYEAIDRAYSTGFFGEFIDQFLDFLEREGQTERTIIMDNVPFHKNEGIRSKIEGKGHTLHFLPPYSPFLNPIEEVFSKWKGIVRQKNCMTEDDLIENIEIASREITESNCAAYFHHMKQFLRPSLQREEIY